MRGGLPAAYQESIEPTGVNSDALASREDIVVHVGFSMGVRKQPCLHRPWLTFPLLLLSV